MAGLRGGIPLSISRETKDTQMKHQRFTHSLAVVTALATMVCPIAIGQAADEKPNIVMLMTDDTGWNDFGCYSGGGMTLGHPTPNIDRIAKEGAVFTSWYG